MYCLRVLRCWAAPVVICCSIILSSPPRADAHQYVEGEWNGDPAEYGKGWLPHPKCDGLPPMMTISNPPWQVVYLNFDGATLKKGQSDARSNSTILVAGSTLQYPAMDFSALGGKDKGTRAIVDELKKVFMTYAVRFVTTRPAEGGYTMAMFGGTGLGTVAGGLAIGVSPVDCKNTNYNDVIFVFANKSSINGSAKKLAFTAAHELAHSFGLEHVTAQKDIMHPALNPATCCWTKSSVTGGSNCGRSEQDADKILTDHVGEGKQDTISPRVWFSRPGDGAVLPPGLTTEVVVADDLGVKDVVFYLDGKKLDKVDDTPYTIRLQHLSDGEHRLKAEARDWINNRATAEVSFTVSSVCLAESRCSQGLMGVGVPCQSGGDCLYGICSLKDGLGTCSVECDPSAKAPLCPAGLSCKELLGNAGCVPGDGYVLSVADKGGCQIYRVRDLGLLALIPLVGILIQILGRPRRRR